jgi:hypothetical protein
MATVDLLTIDVLGIQSILACDSVLIAAAAHLKMDAADLRRKLIARREKLYLAECEAARARAAHVPLYELFT